MKSSAVLFDLDGTLLDTAPEFVYCLNALLQQEGRSSISLENIRHLISFGAKAVVAFGFAMDIHDPSLSFLNERFLTLYKETIGCKTTYFAGIPSLIEKLTQHHIPWGIVTNKPKRFTLPLLEKFDLLHRAASVICGDTLATSKPHPAPIFHACEQLGIAPNQAWYIGDAQTDVEASHQAGMRCAIANYGYIPKNQSSMDWKADHYLQHASEIEKLIF